MRAALEQARLAASIGEAPIGAVVIHEGVIIATGYNRREIDADPSAHAEFIALRAAARALRRWRLSGCMVYVTLEPCLMCAGLMVQSRIDRCVYGASDPKGGALGTLYQVHADARLNHGFVVTGGVLARECSEMLSGFFADLRASHRQRRNADEQEAEGCL
ncbi:MAG: tRNA adenosine(34) deaminase TadA [Coriobacteriia bacterium]|nr:tRNA adenosine(34) deaminase TadA [Coriobacteriia bacterium]